MGAGEHRSRACNAETMCRAWPLTYTGLTSTGLLISSCDKVMRTGICSADDCISATTRGTVSHARPERGAPAAPNGSPLLLLLAARPQPPDKAVVAACRSERSRDQPNAHKTRTAEVVVNIAQARDAGLAAFRAAAAGVGLPDAHSACAAQLDVQVECQSMGYRRRTPQRSIVCHAARTRPSVAQCAPLHMQGLAVLAPPAAARPDRCKGDAIAARAAAPLQRHHRHHGRGQRTPHVASLC